MGAGMIGRKWRRGGGPLFSSRFSESSSKVSEGLGFRVLVSGFKASESSSKVSEGLGFRVQGTKVVKSRQICAHRALGSGTVIRTVINRV